MLASGTLTVLYTRLRSSWVMLVGSCPASRSQELR